MEKISKQLYNEKMDKLKLSLCFLLTFLLFTFSVSWAETTELGGKEDPFGGFEEGEDYDLDPIEDPMPQPEKKPWKQKPKKEKPKSEKPASEESKPSNKKRKKTQKRYRDCIMDAMEEQGMSLGQAEKYCEKLREEGARGSILDVFPDFKKKMVAVDLFDENGDLYWDYLHINTIDRMVGELNRRNIKVDIQGQQIVLTATAASGATVQIGRTKAHKWNQFMNKRSRSLAKGVALALGKGLFKPIKFALKRLTGPIGAVKPAFAAGTCSPYGTPQGLRHYLQQPESSQINVLKQCPRFAGQLLILHQSLSE